MTNRGLSQLTTEGEKIPGDGTVTIHWHTDGNEGLGPDPIIGSLSIGATRDFAFFGWLGLVKGDGPRQLMVFGGVSMG